MQEAFRGGHGKILIPGGFHKKGLSQRFAAPLGSCRRRSSLIPSLGKRRCPRTVAPIKIPGKWINRHNFHIPYETLLLLTPLCRIRHFTWRCQSFDCDNDPYTNTRYSSQPTRMFKLKINTRSIRVLYKMTKSIINFISTMTLPVHERRQIRT